MMITTKRNSLFEFVKEQTQGPGVFGFRFVDLSNESLKNKKLLDESPLNYESEVINNVPGAMYSTAILFPSDNSQEAIILENEPDGESSEDEDVLPVASDPEDQEISINQMYPNSMGLSCCIKNQDALENLKISINFRYYQKVNRKEYFNRYGIILDMDPIGFKSLLQELDQNNPLVNLVKIELIGDNNIISLNNFDVSTIGELKSNLREFDKSQAKKFGSDRDNQTLSGYKEYLFNKLKFSIDEMEKASISESLIHVENVECFINHLQELLDIFDSRNYGLWEAKTYSKSIDFPKVPGEVTRKTVLSYREIEQLKDVFIYDLGDSEKASLSLNLQLSKNSRRKDEAIYIKAQLINTSTPYTQKEGESRYFSAFNELVNQKSFFGVCLTLNSKEMIPYRDSALDLNSVQFSEEEVNRVLYDQFQDYAVGHGTSVKWAIDKNIISVSTEYLPETDTPDVDTTPRRKENITDVGEEFVAAEVFENSWFLEFKSLSTFSNLDNSTVVDGLLEFVQAYSDWIDDSLKRFSNTNKKNVSLQEYGKCRTDCKRMESNIKSLLKENEDDLNTFRQMNSAMFMQLWHSIHVKNNSVNDVFIDGFEGFNKDFYKGCKDTLFSPGQSAAWRPFQLAFILLNLDGILKRADDSKWAKRNELVDLVWFPTGGGKTEAYLGIIAFTILNRRKKHRESGGGTAALMRYTLRLLTKQQFERATLLIMALELQRRWNPSELGLEPIYIGLWVGKGVLPNNLDELEKQYQDLRSSQESGSKSPKNKIPLQNCPWCGGALDPVSFERIHDKNDVYNLDRVLINCSHNQNLCSFSQPRRKKNRRIDQGPIPVSLCDEEIYQHPPALLFATVDKFAQLAHKVSTESNKRQNDTRRLFGKGNWESGKPSDGYLTPDLIIQDELHLLLGPLGSAVALFESAVNQLCSRIENGQTIYPKVISSTATTRNTDLQIMALFNRKLNLFPKPGIECDDSFFSFYKRVFKSKDKPNPTYISKRKYVGILPTGRTHMWMQLRLTAIILVHRAVFENSLHVSGELVPMKSLNPESSAVLNNYHTLISYFNSLKEVGKTESQIDTYIAKEIRKVFNKVLRPGNLLHSVYTYSLSSSELTGRLSGEEINHELGSVSCEWKHESRFTKDEPLPPDLVIATNMISVGIDVSRFNTILMNSMPRNLAEYIQASSRVARNTKGIVFTVHHPFRARDMSHFEKFQEFHQKMYSYVEPISITPFTKKSVKRYLGLYIATIIRHSTEFTNRNSAIAISALKPDQIDNLVKLVTAYFYERKATMNSMSLPLILENLLQEENLKDIESHVKSMIDSWKVLSDEVTSENGTLVYSNKVKGQHQLFVDLDEYEGNIHDEDWQIPQSLRVIEPQAVIKIKLK